MTANASRDGSPVRAYLDEQIAWYDRKSQKNQRRFKQLKVCQIVIAAAIPVAAAASAADWALGGAGGVIVVLEGLQQLQQYQQNWTSYRSTCERLRHEKFMYEAGAGPYAIAPDSTILLAERVEALVSKEQTTWVSHHEEAARGTAAGAG